jgi:hypothetical protein
MSDQRNIEKGEKPAKHESSFNLPLLEPFMRSGTKLDVTDMRVPGVDTPTSQRMESSFQRACNLIMQLKRIQGMAENSEIRVEDSLGVVQTLKVSNLRSQLNSGVESAFSDALQSAKQLNRTELEKQLALTAKDLKARPNNGDAEELIHKLELIEHLLDAPKRITLAHSHFLFDRGIDTMVSAGYRNSQASDDFVKAKSLLANLKGPDGKTLDADAQKLVLAIAKTESGTLDGLLPIMLTRRAQMKAEAGNFDEARDEYTVAIERADKLSLIPKGPDPATPADGNAKLLTRVGYLSFLAEQKQFEAGDKILRELITIDSNAALRRPEVRAAREIIEAKGDPLNPYAPVKLLMEAFERKDMQEASKQLTAFEEAARTVNQNGKQLAKIKELETYIAKENEIEIKAELTRELAVRRAFLQAPLIGQYMHARLALASGQADGARGLLEDLKKNNPEFAKEPKLKIDELIEECKKPSEAESLWTRTKNFFKELLCDVVAAGAGVGTAALFSWSGPGALFAATTAGAGTYTGMKALVFGADSIGWDTPVLGALDGVTGGTSFLVRKGLTSAGGKLFTKELTETAVVRAGGDVGALAGLEGFQLGGKALEVAGKGLKEMGKELPYYARMQSAIPLAGGNAEYRAALNSYRTLRNTYYGANAGRDMLSVGAGSLIYNTAHEGANFYRGKHDSWATTSQAIAGKTFNDSMFGAFAGPAARGMGGRFVEGRVGMTLGLPTLRDGLSTGIVPQMENAWDQGHDLIDTWIQIRQLQRLPSPQEIHDRYLNQLPGEPNPRVGIK